MPCCRQIQRVKRINHCGEKGTKGGHYLDYNKLSCFARIIVVKRIPSKTFTGLHFSDPVFNESVYWKELI